MPKRTRSSSSRKSTSYSKRAKTASKRGRTGYANVLRTSTVNRRVNSLYKMIETKEGTYTCAANTALPHNNTYVVTLADGVTPLNPFATTAGGGGDPMTGQGQRIGDQITCRGVSIKMFIENALERARVHYRVMLLKGAKGEAFTRANIFKGDSNNKMIDQVNTERFTIVAQKVFNLNCTNNAPSSVGITGIPTGGTFSGISSKVLSMWIPGKRFGKNGEIRYENGSAGQIKFYDYRLVFVAYDWFGTPQDANNVGRINELFTKLYFKDA